MSFNRDEPKRSPLRPFAAAQTGGTVAIPVSEYAARIAPTEQAAALQDHLRTEPDGFSRAEAQEWQATRGEQLQADLDRSASEAENADAFRASADRVRDTIKAQLTQAGVFREAVNDAYATVPARFYAVTAARLGLTPEQLYQQYPLTVGAQLPTQGAVFNQFAGQQAATADHYALANAAAMESVMDMEDIRQQTGWHRGVDGKWRFEISDADAELRIGHKGVSLGGLIDETRYPNAVMPLGDLLHHPALFAAYPGLSDLRVAFVKQDPNGGERGAFGVRDGVGRIQLNDDMAAHEALSTLLHEIQHGIQNLEGFATGASADNIATVQEAARSSIPDLRADVREAQRQYDDAVDMGYPEAQVARRKAELDAAQLELSANEALADAGDPMDQYRRAAGEVEARNTQARQFMSDRERQVLEPSHTADVSDADVIVTFNGKDAASAPVPANSQGQVLHQSALTPTAQAVQQWQRSLSGLTPRNLQQEARMATPAVLTALGAREIKLTITGERLRNIRNKHSKIPEQVFLDLPALLADPLFVYPHREGGLTVVIDARTKAGDPIVVGVRDGRITTVSEQEALNGSTGEQRIEANLRRALQTSDSKVYARQKESLDRARLPSEGQSRDISEGAKTKDRANVTYRDQLVKKYGENFYQNQQAPRGAYNPATFNIAILKGADLSTFLHETGHHFLEMQLQLAAQLAARETLTAGEQSLVADSHALLKWFGVRDIAEWQNMPFEERRAHHETFARGFEAYLYEGKAPSVELNGLFQRLRAWLVNVYKDLKNLNVELTPEVRGVMDRMVATTEEITMAEQARGMLPMFESAIQAGMTPEEWAAYQQQGVQPTLDAIDDLQARGSLGTSSPGASSDRDEPESVPRLAHPPPRCGGFGGPALVLDRRACPGARAVACHSAPDRGAVLSHRTAGRQRPRSAAQR